MTYDEAMTEVIVGTRMRHDGMQEGIYIEHVFGRGVLRCWPVDCPSDEPNRAQCEFRANTDDLAADWYELPAPVRAPVAQPPGNPKPIAAQAAAAGWGKVSPQLKPIEPTVGWGKPLKPIAPPVEFCAECDYAKTACICAKPEAQSEQKQEKSKWGL